MRKGKLYSSIGTGKKIAWTAAVLCAVAVFVLLLSPWQQYLVLQDRDSARIYGMYPIQDGETFSVSFIHSVNQSPVIESYEIENGEIYVIQLQYYSFGAGMPTQPEEGQTLTYGEDGAMILSGFHRKMTDMVYVVGMVSDHILSLSGQEYSLRDRCGRGSPVKFSVGTFPTFFAKFFDHD